MRRASHPEAPSSPENPSPPSPPLPIPPLPLPPPPAAGQCRVHNLLVVLDEHTPAQRFTQLLRTCVCEPCVVTDLLLLLLGAELTCHEG
jgi:hypothetical protein